MIVLIQNSLVNQLCDAFVREVRIDRAGAKTKERRHLMHISGLTGFQNNGDLGSLLRPDEVLLHRGHRQKRRHRNVVLVHAAVREDDDVLSLCRRAVHCDVQLLQRALQRRVLVIQERDGLRMEPGLIQRTDLHEIHSGQDRMIDLQHTAVLRLFIQKIAVGSDVDRRVRDHLLTEGVNRRVRDLREQLLEIIEQELVLTGENRERNIVSHGCRGLHAVLCHRKNVVTDILVGIAENLVQLVPQLLIVGRDLLVRNRKTGQMQKISVQPLTVRLTARIAALAFFIRDDLFLLCVHQKDASGLQAGFLHDVLRRDVQNTDLGRQDQTVVIRDVIAGRSKAVPVQSRTHDVAVREQNRSRAVPGLHHRRIIMVEILFVLLHKTVILPRLRHNHHHGERKGHSVHVEELQRVVQHSGIRSFFRDHRENLVDVLLHDRRGHRLLTGQHTVDVAADGVDLAVVRDHAVRMRAVPGRRRVRGETGMHDGNGRLKIMILQIVIEFAQLHDQEHALVNNGSRGERADIGILTALFEFAADHVESAVEINALFHILRLLNEALHDAGHGILRKIAQNFRMHRHLSPAEELQSLLFRDDFQHPHRKGAL